MSDIEITWDYPGHHGNDVLPWPKGMPVPSPGDTVYSSDDAPHKVLCVSYRPYKNWVHIVCSYA